MSKIEKFLSIGIGILQGMQERGRIFSGFHPFEMNALGVLAAIQAVRDELIYQNPELNQKSMKPVRGAILFSVSDEKGVNLIAQIKIYRQQEKKGKLISGIHMIREVTDIFGKLELKLETGHYLVEISKGSEYEILKDMIEIVENKCKVIKRYSISRIFDIEPEGWYAGDLHHHSIYSSPVYGGTDDVIETPMQVCHSMKAMGLFYGALSDHHNILNHEEWSAQKGEDFIPLLSKEISTSNGHVLSLGVKQDVIYQIPEEKNRTDAVLRNEFIRITGKIRKAGGLAQLNHPMDLNKSISWNPAFNDLLNRFQTLEIWNGSAPMFYGTTNEQAALLWLKLLENHVYIPAVTGSDTHNCKADDYIDFIDEMMLLEENILKMDNMLHGAAWSNYREEIKCFLSLCREALPVLTKWMQNNLSSGGVRTYVRLTGKPDEPKILKALGEGNSFLTNGPILLMDIKGAGPGETLLLAQNEQAEVTLKIYSNKELCHLYIYANHGESLKFKLSDRLLGQGKNYFDYSCVLRELPLQDWQWFFAVAADDFTSMAMTNPIFLSR